MLHRIGVLPVRYRYENLELTVVASKIIGYRLVCSCGERGPVRSTYALARIDAGAHRAVTDDEGEVAALD